MLIARRFHALAFAGALHTAVDPRGTERPLFHESATPLTYSGRERQLRVSPPRLDESAMRMDGVLEEAQWKEAAVLTGFSQFYPRDGVPAEDSTVVLVWYSATAIHFGIRAYEPHGPPRATLADRDKIDSDDRIDLLLGTFNDSRQALVLAVNPLGVQMDGTLIENNQPRMGTSISLAYSREAPDLNPDFVFQSKGRITEYGYEVEVRVPFKSLKYQSAAQQTWGFNVVRVVQHSGREDSWAPALRANVSFLGQSGTLENLTELRRGVVLDATPEITYRRDGALVTPASPWEHSADRRVGGSLRWGVNNNLTANATINPDFSQIEADAGQIQADPRQALFYSEKRPFFLDGTEYFATPKSLIYTRRIVQPVVAMKLTGKLRGANVGILAALDDTVGSLTGHGHPLYLLGRVQRNVGKTRLGLTMTERDEDSRFNRVASLDVRRVFGQMYSASSQYAESWTRTTPTADTRAGPLWNAVVSRNGKAFTFRYFFEGISESFRTQSGFIGRGGVVNGALDQRFTWHLPEGGFVESIAFNPAFYPTWRYQSFVHQGDAIEKKLHNRIAVTARGGWSGDFTVMAETFGYDPALYANYAIKTGPTSTAAFTGSPRIGNRDLAIALNTPQWKRFSGTAYYLWGSDENFYEWAPATIIFANYEADFRPTDRLRLNASFQKTSYVRETDGSEAAEIRLPRAKLEYQLARPLFVRLVGEWQSMYQDALRDDGRTNLPLLVGGQATLISTTSTFRSDVLLSYRPVPGTVFFAGYGAGFIDPLNPARQFSADRALRLRDYQQTSNVFYVKASYLYRVP